ncbi:hypothetical protein LZ32DRAFT_352084 [Colletotrichum eremochloae]|nr:hypothetical protein LZ32DRAFT_352084 [Colletotrichum eremochloae]
MLPAPSLSPIEHVCFFLPPTNHPPSVCRDTRPTNQSRRLAVHRFWDPMAIGRSVDMQPSLEPEVPLPSGTAYSDGSPNPSLRVVPDSESPADRDSPNARSSATSETRSQAQPVIAVPAACLGCVSDTSTHPAFPSFGLGNHVDWPSPGIRPRAARQAGAAAS